MKRLLIPTLAAVVLTGCNSAKEDAEFQEAKRNFDRTTKDSLDALQWRLDDATAVGLFNDGTRAGVNRYLTFRKCHEEPPTHDKNKRVCADLQQRVAKAEAKAEAAHAKEKAAW